jgi:hypothetical protein
VPDDLPALQLKAALAVLPMWVRTSSFDIDERLEELEALALEQDTLIQNVNEGIERVAAAIMGDYSQTRTREEPNDRVAAYPGCKSTTGVGSFKTWKSRRRTYTRVETSIAHGAHPRADR